MVEEAERREYCLRRESEIHWYVKKVDSMLLDQAVVDVGTVPAWLDLEERESVHS